MKDAIWSKTRTGEHTITRWSRAGDEFDVGELVTWLNDAVLMAPTFLLIPSVSWAEVDDHSIDVTLADSGRSVTARVFLDDQGRPADSSTTDRYLDMAGGLVRTRWTTPVSSWAQAGGRPFPGAASAVWLLPDGPMTYIEGRFDPEKAVFGDRSGTYRATTHLHALLTIEQLFRRVISIQSAARDTHATRVLLFSVLDTPSGSLVGQAKRTALRNTQRRPLTASERRSRPRRVTCCCGIPNARFSGSKRFNAVSFCEA